MAFDAIRRTHPSMCHYSLIRQTPLTEISSLFSSDLVRYHRGRILIPARISLLINSIYQLSIAAWLISRYNSHHNYLSTSVRNRTRYLLFCAIWTTLLVTLFLMMFLLASGHFLSSVASHGIL